MNFKILLTLLLLFIGYNRACFGRDPVFSPEKEGVKIGVVEHPYPEPRNGIVQCFILGTTNYLNNLINPLTFQESVEFELRGTNGVLVAKTAAGKEYGQRVNTNLTKSDKGRHRLVMYKNFDNDWRQLAFFKIDEVPRCL